MNQKTKQLQTTENHKHCHHHYNGECNLSPSMCVCSKVENMTGKEKVKLYLPYNAKAVLINTTYKLKELFEADGHEVEIVRTNPAKP